MFNIEKIKYNFFNIVKIAVCIAILLLTYIRISSYNSYILKKSILDNQNRTSSNTSQAARSELSKPSGTSPLQYSSRNTWGKCMIMVGTPMNTLSAELGGFEPTMLFGLYFPW